LVVAGEYLAMWQSRSWNGQEAAFRFTMVILGVLIFLVLPATNDGRHGAFLEHDLFGKPVATPDQSGAAFSASCSKGELSHALL
jgi:hypothetical protein